MAFTSGTMYSSGDFARVINEFLTANGWTNLRGAPDNDVASPKAARYWRLLINRTQNGDLNKSVRLFNLRETPGGPNIATDPARLTVTNYRSGPVADLIGAGATDVFLNGTGFGYYTPATIVYDFGTPQVVRELYLRCGSNMSYAPTECMLQWSHDGEIWTTLVEHAFATWSTAATYQTLTVPDGAVWPGHYSATAANRAGAAERMTISNNTDTRQSGERCYSDDLISWQGPGYDGTRRAFIHMRFHGHDAEGTINVEMSYSALWNAAVKRFRQQPGESQTPLIHYAKTGGSRYWLYLNSSRLIIVTEVEVGDYCSSYIGFLSSFVPPEFYPQPMCISASPGSFLSTSRGVTAQTMSIQDPAYTGLSVMMPDGSERVGGNADRTNAGRRQAPSSAMGSFPTVWPTSFRTASNNTAYPNNLGSGASGAGNFGTGLLAYLVPTVQGDFPLFPAIVQDRDHGNLGVLAGVFVVPGAGILVPEQELTLADGTYRAFPGRSRRDAAVWFAVKEE